MLNTIVPLLLIGWLGVFGILIPNDSGEKLRYYQISYLIELKYGILWIFSFLVTVILALVFLTMEIESQLAPAGEHDAPLINWLILVNYVLLCPSFGWAILTGRWLKHKDRVNPPQYVYNLVQVIYCRALWILRQFIFRFFDENHAFLRKIRK